MNKDLKIISGIIGIFIIFISIILIYSAYYAPLNANSYETQISSIDNQFQLILTNDRRYMGTSEETPSSTVETELKKVIDQMDSLQKRGFPSQYNSFHEHYTNALEDYLHYRSTLDESYLNEGSNELEIAYKSFNNASITYNFENIS